MVLEIIEQKKESTKLRKGDILRDSLNNVDYMIISRTTENYYSEIRLLILSGTAKYNILARCSFDSLEDLNNFLKRDNKRWKHYSGEDYKLVLTNK